MQVLIILKFKALIKKLENKHKLLIGLEDLPK